MKLFKAITFFVLLAMAAGTQAQTITLPPSGDNQKSIVTQFMGPVSVTVTYNSPDVTGPNGQDRKGKIWGQLIPNGFTDLGFGYRTPAPWRAGANENTVIEFSHDVEIEGKPLKAGKYGLHMATGEKEWIVIFSKNSTSWGSYFYKEEEDALRVTIKPEKAPYHEWLSYEFTDRAPNACTLALFWEEIKAPIKISVPNMEEVYLATIREELRGSKGFTWQNWQAAANYCVQNNINLEEALTWAENAISGPYVGNENFTTLSTKSQVLAKMGKIVEAEETMDKAINHATASAMDIHGYARQLQNQGKAQKALETYKLNQKKNPDAWFIEVGLMRGYSATGDLKKALKNAKIALEKAPDEPNKNAIKAAIEKLEKGEAL